MMKPLILVLVFLLSCQPTENIVETQPTADLTGRLVVTAMFENSARVFGPAQVVVRRISAYTGKHESKDSYDFYQEYFKIIFEPFLYSTVQRFDFLGFELIPEADVYVYAENAAGTRFSFKHTSHGVYANNDLQKHIGAEKLIKLFVVTGPDTFMARAHVLDRPEITFPDTSHVYVEYLYPNPKEPYFSEQPIQDSASTWIPIKHDSKTALSVRQVNSEFEGDLTGVKSVFNTIYADRSLYHRFGKDMYVFDMTGPWDHKLYTNAGTDFNTNSSLPLKRFQTNHYRIISMDSSMRRMVLMPDWIYTSQPGNSTYNAVTRYFTQTFTVKKDFKKLIEWSPFYLTKNGLASKDASIQLLGSFGIISTSYGKTVIRPIRSWNTDTCNYPGVAVNTHFED